MHKLILSETITLFKTGGSKGLDGRLERACLCDLDKLRDGINLELNALPTDKKNNLKKVIYDYLEYIVRGEFNVNKDD